MKIIFYTTDPIFETLLSSFEDDSAVVCANRNDLDKLINQFQPCTVLFDFDDNELNCREVSKDYITRGNAFNVLVTGAMELPDIVKIQNSEFGFDGYLTKPVSKEIVLDVIGDIELAQLDNSVEENKEPEVVELDESLVFNIRDIAPNESFGAVDVEKSLEKEKELVAAVEKDLEEDTEVDFEASELNISSEVREVINEHNQGESHFDDELNKDIQRKFDSVFGKQIKEENVVPVVSITPESNSVKVETEAISFDADEAINENLNKESSDLSKEVLEENSSNEVSMSDDKDEIGGLEFNIPEESDDSETNEEGLSFSLDDDDSKDEATPPEESEDDGLVFDTDEGESLDLSAESDEVEPIVDTTPSDEDALEFSVDDSESLALGDDDTQAAPVEDNSDDSLDLGEMSGELNLSSGDDETEAAPIEAVSDDGLDFGDDEGGLSLSAEGEEVDNASIEDSEDGLDFSVSDDKDESSSSEDSDDGLDFSVSDDKDESSSIEAVSDDGLDFSVSDDEAESDSTEGSGEDLDFSVSDDEVDAVAEVDHPSVESTDSFQVGTSDDIDKTINSIVASPQDSTGEFDMSNLQKSADGDQEEEMKEFDYKTSSGFTPDLGAVNELDSSTFEENTNPTIISQTGTLSEGDLLSDIEDSNTVTEENISNELSFTETREDIDLFGSTPESDNTAETLTQTVQTGSMNIADATTSTNSAPVPTMSAKEEYESFRSYDEDEMLRLQGTIRQLREEREGLMGQINHLKSEKQLLEQDNLGIKAELDEVKIELGIIKKRHHDEISDKEYHYKMNQDKKELYENKAKHLQKDFDRLNQKVRIDFNQVKQREIDLESKLELTVMDSESQVKTRDMKILELKRKIDSLEFNMENSSIREIKHRDDKSKLEERLAKIMKTLRGSIQLIEDDLDDLETKNTKELD